MDEDDGSARFFYCGLEYFSWVDEGCIQYSDGYGEVFFDFVFRVEEEQDELLFIEVLDEGGCIVVNVFG